MSVEAVTTYHDGYGGGSGGSVSSGSMGRGTMPRSMVISPNLDKLLEHEERLRKSSSLNSTSLLSLSMAPTTPGPTVLETQQVEVAAESGESAMGLSGEYPIGLPPPPPRRRPQSPRSPVSPSGDGLVRRTSRRPDSSRSHDSTRPSTSSSSQSNPYINPAPTAEDLFKGGEMQQLQRRRLVSHGWSDRVSISSTIYPPDSHESHSTSLFQEDRASFHPMDSPKPPLPTTPKPVFPRPRDNAGAKPATTNFLDLDERADLVRKTRKLARMFGETPNADAMVHQESGSAFIAGRRKHSEHDAFARGTSQRLNLAAVRRHSMPLSPDQVSFISLASPTRDNKDQNDYQFPPAEPATSKNAIRSGSPVSFIDLSDEQNVSLSPSQSLFDTASLVDPEEEDRRRKRERLAKLHRFLGSRVPASLVLGFNDDTDAYLPPPPPSPPKRQNSDGDDNNPRKWLRRRRSSSVVLQPSTWSSDLERLKTDLDDREKALNVRRAHKMEKVFGVAPPLTLYHTRHTPTPSLLPKPIPQSRLPAPPSAFNPPAGSKTPKKKKDARPGTSESSKGLLPQGSSAFAGFDDRFANARSAETSSTNRHSFIYNHYDVSLNSLNDIIDRDDRASLAELHEYLHNDRTPSQDNDENDRAPTPTGTRDYRDRRLSNASSAKSDRRRSLPARTSLLSLNSEYSLAATIITPSATPTTADYMTPGYKPGSGGMEQSFQQRRRRAAKLTQFFGVDYRELINDVLENIESGVQTDSRNGTLRDEEVEDLLVKLRRLKSKRQNFV